MSDLVSLDKLFEELKIHLSTAQNLFNHATYDSC